MSPLTILSATLPVYLTMLAGAVARYFGWLPKEADSGIMHLTVKLLFPALVIERIVGNPGLQYPSQVLLAGFLGYSLVAVSLLICFGVARLFGMKSGSGARTFAVCNAFQNYGYVAIPVTEALFGRELTGVLFTFTIGVEFAMWTIGVGMLTGFKKVPIGHLLNAPVLSIFMALALHYAGAGPYIPSAVHTFLGQLGACAIPLAVILIGASIMDLIGAERIRWDVAVLSPILRQLLLPLLMLCVARWVPMTGDLQKVIIVQAAMPAAVFTIVVSRVYGGHPPTAVLVVLATSLVSLVTVPWAIGFGIWFTGK